MFSVWVIIIKLLLIHGKVDILLYYYLLNLTNDSYVQYCQNIPSTSFTCPMLQRFFVGYNCILLFNLRRHYIVNFCLTKALHSLWSWLHSIYHTHS